MTWEQSAENSKGNERGKCVAVTEPLGCTRLKTARVDSDLADSSCFTVISQCPVTNLVSCLEKRKKKFMTDDAACQLSGASPVFPPKRCALHETLKYINIV